MTFDFVLFLVLCLGSDNYRLRQSASKALKAMPAAEPVLRLHMKDSLEQMKRSGVILEHWERLDEATWPKPGWYHMDIDSVGAFANLRIIGKITFADKQYAYVEYHFNHRGPTFSRIEWRKWTLTKVER